MDKWALTPEEIEVAVLELEQRKLRQEVPLLAYSSLHHNAEKPASARDRRRDRAPGRCPSPGGFPSPVK